MPGDLVLYPESQWKQFQGFLVRANRYPGLQLVGVAGGRGSEVQKEKIVLVEVCACCRYCVCVRVCTCVCV